eukprot:scaffold5235_cov121-Cylindrotheca_fusiformis.AAC.1
MEETDQQHKPLLLESQKDAVVEHASQEEADKQHRTFQPMFLESQEDIFVDERAPIGKVRFGLIALLVLAIAAVIAFCNNGSQPLSDIDLLATVVMPGVDISNLNETTPQYRALEWLAYNDTRALTIKNDATELLERFSLATFYYSVGRGYFCNDWLTISSHCDWVYFDCDEYSFHHSIRCDADGRVTILHLESNGLVGRIPSEIGHLKQLEYLYLQYNKFSGPIPSEIGNLQQLKHLYLQNNKLSGPIPSEIGHLQQLEYLLLDGNELSGPIPSEIGHLQQLDSLELGLNTFSGPIPSEIGDLQQLDSLKLGLNTFSGPIPSEIGNLQQLRSLYLASNKFSGPIPSEIGHLQQLLNLYLASNNFSGPIPSEIGHLQQLTTLELQNNIGLTGTVPVEVGQLESIMQAVFSNTSLTGGLDDLALCKKRYFTLRADCGGLNPKITCECCTQCCRTDENGHTRCDPD